MISIQNMMSTIVMVLVLSGIGTAQFIQKAIVSDTASIESWLVTNNFSIARELFNPKNTKNIGIGIVTNRDKAIFCEIENQIQRVSKISLKFRIGNLDYLNNIEGKNFDHIDYITNHQTNKP